MIARYGGGQQADPEGVGVAAYLRDNYLEPGGSRGLTDARIAELLDGHRGKLETGLRCGSFEYYIGDQIADAEGLEWNEEGDE